MQQNNQQMTQMMPIVMMMMFMNSMNKPRVERFELPTVDNVKEAASNITGGAKNLINKALGKEGEEGEEVPEEQQEPSVQHAESAQQQSSEYDGVDKEAALGGAPNQEENAEVDNQGQPEKRMATEIPPTKVLDRRSKEWNGHSIVDPAQWALPQKRPPICVTEKQCPVCPLVAETYPNVMVRQKILPFDNYDEKNWN